MHIRRRTIAWALAICGSALFPDSAWAASTATNLSVTATVVSSCAVNSTSTLAFGAISAGTFPVNSTGSVTFTCSGGTAWFVTATLSSNASGSQPRMVSSGQYLSYNIYSDGGRTVAFPTALGTLGSGNTGGTGTGGQQTVTVYGQVPSQPLPPAATYTDTLTLTVNW
ncbi:MULTISPECIES: spore coat U domain-containing protein [unclassified Novosphingobium]|nr:MULTISPECIES: spore coat U domain-containing protein [unclassified Novosphingobium]